MSLDESILVIARLPLPRVVGFSGSMGRMNGVPSLGPGPEPRGRWGNIASGS